nr:neuromedin-U receptor 2-like [Hydra vulgaris]XP_047122411.1 neuromedin-U receptor 2-like [Hydra vulgaris]XP_047122412.1 neuromedin-U receptor 2-like [Hydra vulgaris]
MSVLWVVFCIIIDLAIVLANLMEQLLIVQKWNSLDRIDFLLLSLSVSDFASGIASLGIDVWHLSREMTLTFVPIISQELMIKSIDSVYLFSVFSSTFHVIVLAIERFYAIKYPKKYYVINKFKTKFGTIAIIWMITLIFTPIFSMLSICLLNTSIYIRACLFAFIAFFVMVIYVYIFILLVVQRKSVVHDFGSKCSLHQDHLKIMTTLCIFIGASFAVCLMPITVCYFNEDIYQPIANLDNLYQPIGNLDNLYQPIGIFAITLDSLINPCIYFAKVIYESRSINRSRYEKTHYLLEVQN